MSFLKSLLEVFNTTLDLEFERDFIKNVWYTYFLIDIKEFKIQIEELDFKNFNIDSNKTCCSIIFGDVDTEGAINIKALNRNKKTSGTFGVVINAVHRWLQKHPKDIIVFAAKKDNYYESRVSLYSTLSTMVAKRYGYNFKNESNDDGSYFILSKEKLSPKEERIIEKEITGSVSIKTKIRKIIPSI